MASDLDASARAREILDASIARALAGEAKWEPNLGALLPEADRQGRLSKDASLLLEKFGRFSELAPLFGCTIGVKDIIHVDGLPTMAGGKIPAEVLYGPEASVVTKLREGGALIMGKMATTQFAYFTPSPTNNPLAPGFTPGGSSSGSAAGVAAGLCDIAVGSQTFGSTSRPASFCGVVGYKPSYNRIPTDGFVRGAVSIDHPGFFSKKVGSLFEVASVVMDGWEAVKVKILHSDRINWTLGVPDGPLIARCEPDALASFEKTLKRLESVGFVIVRIPSLPDFATLDRSHRSLMSFEYAQFHSEWFKDYRPLYSSHLKELMTMGASVTPEEAEMCRKSCTALRKRLHAVMRDHDLDAWIAPATIGPPPQGHDHTGDPVMSLPWTHSGLPSITVPADNIPFVPPPHKAPSLDTEGEKGATLLPTSSPMLLPIGVTLAGRWGEDEKLLGLATDVEWAFGVKV